MTDVSRYSNRVEARMQFISPSYTAEATNVLQTEPASQRDEMMIIDDLTVSYATGIQTKVIT